jgi:RNA exonuclease 1
MFTSKNLFSEIVCPYSQTCVLPRCIFKHPDEKPSASTAIANSLNETHSGTEQEVPRKRQKLEDESRSRVEQSSPSVGKASAPSSVKSISEPKQVKKSLAASRPISPPPMKRSNLSSSTAPFKPSASQNVSTSRPAPKPPVPTKTSSKAPAKAEGLNPRALKIPTPASHDMRFRLLRALHEQFVRLNTELAKDASPSEEHLVLSDQALITRALDIEEDAASTPVIYSNIVKNKILLYKRMTVPKWMEERAKEVAAEKVKAKGPGTGTGATTTKSSEPPKPIETGLTPKQELLVMKRLQTHISSLAHAGFTTTPPTVADIASANKGVEAAKGWEVCDRCRSRFQVFPSRRESDGALASGGACTYHPGKPYFPPREGLAGRGEKREKRYRCCNEGVGDSTGCTRGDNHVFKITEAKRLAAVLAFECTPEPTGEGGGEVEKRPVCVDGEMGYTTYGLELIRLTATSWPDGHEIFDVLVKPVGLILDLNSRYSGVWPKDFAAALPYVFESSLGNASPPQGAKLKMVDSPAIARNLLFKHLTPSTPLIGHGLENDLNAMRVIHPTIVDTSLLFPHKAGLPYRNGLKALMGTLLGKDIQMHGGLGEANENAGAEGQGVSGGHDSKEDANAAGELVRYAIKEEWGRMRREGWSVGESGGLKEPSGKGGFRAGAATSGMGEVERDGTKILVRGGESGSGNARKRGREEVDE